MKCLFHSNLNLQLTTRLGRGCHFTTRLQVTDPEINNNRNSRISCARACVRIRTNHIRNRACCKTFLNGKIEIKFSKLIDRILVKAHNQSRTKSIVGLPVIILVVALLVIVLRFVVVFLVIGLLK